MRLQHPFEWLPDSYQPRALALLILIALITFTAVSQLNTPLETDAAPLGIVSLQLAGDLAQARQIIASWHGTGQLYAALNIGFDYLYMVVYAITVSLACTVLAKRWRPRSRLAADAGIVLAWLVLAAAVLDAVENYCLIRILVGTSDSVWPALAKWLAMTKFSIIAIAFGYIFIGCATLAAAKFRRAR